MLNTSGKTIIYFAHLQSENQILDRIKRIKPDEELPDFFDWLVEKRKDTGGVIINCKIIEY